MYECVCCVGVGGVCWNTSLNGNKTYPMFLPYLSKLPASVALGGSVGCASNWRPGRQHSFVEIDHEIFSTVILSLPLNQEGQLSVSGERMCSVLVNRLED